MLLSLELEPTAVHLISLPLQGAISNPASQSTLVLRDAGGAVCVTKTFDSTLAVA